MFLPISAAPVAKSKYAAGSKHFGRTGAFTQTHSPNNDLDLLTNEMMHKYKVSIPIRTLLNDERKIH